MTTDDRTDNAVRVDPERLSPGVWHAASNQHRGEGDICAAYSADTIGLEGRIRGHFVNNAHTFVCTALQGGEHLTAVAYRLIPPDFFEQQAVSYAERSADAKAARADPLGFYHGVIVRYRGRHWVLVGPPVRFVPGQAQQPGLFAPE